MNIHTWTPSLEQEHQMARGHGFLWQRMVDLTKEDMSHTSVLDFGCNQGDFLHHLYRHRPFRRGVGVDIAEAAISYARNHRGHLPLEYLVASDPSAIGEQFNVAYSHEVLYLLPDLDVHARQMWDALAPGGVYYASMGCHAGNPLWPRWRVQLAQINPHTKPQDYSLADVSRAFGTVGFQVSATSFQVTGFLEFGGDFFNDVDELITYYTKTKVLFRMRRPEAGETLDHLRTRTVPI